jgi:hypothetical protein
MSSQLLVKLEKEINEDALVTRKGSRIYEHHGVNKKKILEEKWRKASCRDLCYENDFLCIYKLLML